MPKLKPTLNQSDIKLIKDLVKNLIWEITPQIINLSLKQFAIEHIKPLKEQINHLPSKDEFYTCLKAIHPHFTHPSIK